jgi:hypothetical protein
MPEKIEFTTTLIPLNKENLNGRIYMDNENLRENIADFNERVTRYGCVYGEFDPPRDRFDTSLSMVSHVVQNVRIEDDKVVGDIRILNTHFGKELREIFDQMVFRPRSAGIINDDGTVTIKKIFTFDAIEADIDSFAEMKPVKEIKRIFNEIDPYGEEEWE